MDDSIFRHNPTGTLNHNYWRPVGKSLWRQKVKEDGHRGVKAKTVYPERPQEWPEEEPWANDAAWALVKAGLMLGKSIGFVTLASHPPAEEEVRRRPELATVRRIVD